jgi:transposase-like protein
VTLCGGCQDWSVAKASYEGYRYPIEVIEHVVWLYHRFALSLPGVEELLVARGVVVSYEAIRSWCSWLAWSGPNLACAAGEPASATNGISMSCS